MLRRPGATTFLFELYDYFKQVNNVFSTTIHVLVSAAVKLARAVELPTGTRLYRGLGRLSKLPESFDSQDELGRCGYLEWGFMSTTSDQSVAMKVS